MSDAPSLKQAMVEWKREGGGHFKRTVEKSQLFV